MASFPTISDVARKAGVSLGTVSHFLNGSARVSTETAQKVQQAIDSLEYQALGNRGHRARRPLGRIAVLSPFRHSPSFLQRLDGIADALVTSRFELVLSTVTDPDELAHYLADPTLDRRVDGLIVVSMNLNDAQARSLDATGLPVVLVERLRDGFPGVGCDDARGGALVAELFLGRGWAPCAFVGEVAPRSDFRLDPSAARRQGYTEALRAAGQPLAASYDLAGDCSEAGGRRMAEALLALAQRPRAIFAMSDIQAVGVVKAVRAAGLRVPEDVAVAGFDDVQAASWIELTTVSQRLEESGRVAAELLLERIREPFRPRRSVRLEVALVERATTGGS